MAKPITPAEVASAKGISIPDFVIDAFNERIAAQWDGRRSVVLQRDVVKLCKAKNPDVEFDFKWLDVEPMYRSAGWRVIYEKPAYNESYEPTFEFSK